MSGEYGAGLRRGRYRRYTGTKTGHGVTTEADNNDAPIRKTPASRIRPGETRVSGKGAAITSRFSHRAPRFNP